MENTNIYDVETLNDIEISQKKKLFRLALYAGEIMIKNGAEVYRTEDTVHRFFRSKDFYYVNAFVTPTVIILGDERYDGFSFMKNIKNRTINLEKVALVNSFARDFVSSNMDLDEALCRLIEIDKTVSYSYKSRLIFTSIGSAAFSMMLGGNIFDFIATFFIALLVIYIYDKIDMVSSTAFLSNAICGVVIAILAITVGKLNIDYNLNTIIVGAIMPFLPGVALTNGMRDFISGDLISGSSRTFEAVLVAVALASGIGSILSIWKLFGGVL